MNELAKRVRAVRRTVRVRERTMIEGQATYSCDCGMSFKVAFARGVDLPGEWRLGIPAPEKIPCQFCDDTAVYEADSFMPLIGGRVEGQAYFRIPSRHAVHGLDGFHAQLVQPEDER